MSPLAASVEAAPTRRAALALAAAAVAVPAWAGLPGIVTPVMRLAGMVSAPPRVAITFDACPGSFDWRIAAALLEGGVPATIFVSGVWMRQNPKGLAFLLAHPDLFSLQNHGARHLACVLDERRIWGLTPAVDLAGVETEVEDGARAVAEVTGQRPAWFRGAGAIYSPPALDLIRRLGFGVAGFSLNGDVGTTLPAAAVAARIGAARAGDVVISHINQPHRASGKGVAKGVLALRRQGVRFVRLDALKPVDMIYS
ncbi:MAG TPA: polysaccharide deacetylase family protein [Caulobacteraceae bacterium]|nr:polysaccharide deacetylase family protein [Caulobacteraceae bacterium]